MALPDWVLIGGGIVTTVAGSVIAAIRIKPDARKMRADSAAAILASAGAMATGFEREMSELRGQVREMTVWRKGLESRLRRHARWDDQAVTQMRAAGIALPDPPILFDDDEEVKAT